MLKPDKHTNPMLSVVNIVGLIIEELQDNKILSYDDLLFKVIEDTSDSVKEVFVYAVSFLFILDKIKYIPEIDSLRLQQ